MGSILACRWSRDGAEVRLFSFEFNFCLPREGFDGWLGMFNLFLKSNMRSEMWQQRLRMGPCDSGKSSQI